MNRASQWLYSFNTNEELSPNYKKAKKISVTGGKGGVGKTSISLKLAKDLAQMGKKVLLLDCDFNLSNTAIKLEIPVTNHFEKLLSGESLFNDCLHKDGTFHLLSGCNGSLDVFESRLDFSEIIIDIISSHEMDYDFIFLDCPAGLSKDTLTLNSYSDDRIVVLNPDRSSITDSYSLIKILKMKYGVNSNHILVNKFENKKQFARVVKTMSETVENFLGCRTHILGGIPQFNSGREHFDREFIHGENSAISEILTKFVERYSDVDLTDEGLSIDQGMLMAKHTQSSGHYTTP